LLPPSGDEIADGEGEAASTFAWLDRGHTVWELDGVRLRGWFGMGLLSQKKQGLATRSEKHQ
jgi:hypothetical protein